MLSRQKAAERVNRAVAYEQLFGRDSDWVAGAHMLMRFYEDAARTGATGQPASGTNRQTTLESLDSTSLYGSCDLRISVSLRQIFAGRVVRSNSVQSIPGDII